MYYFPMGNLHYNRMFYYKVLGVNSTCRCGILSATSSCGPAQRDTWLVGMLKGLDDVTEQVTNLWYHKQNGCFCIRLFVCSFS